MNYVEKTNCRVCESPDLLDVLSLGRQAIPEWTRERKAPTCIPLDIVLCQDCDLLQLRHTTNPDLLWNENYGYRSGINETMVAHLGGIARSVEKIANLFPGDRVIDIGCNDGTLLGQYTADVHRIGFEPSRNVGTYAWQDGNVDKLYYQFFSADPFIKDYGEHSAKAITAISMFYDLDDPNKFVSDVEKCLAPDGVFVVQQNYLVGMLHQNAFDNICHEHVEYYSLLSMDNLLGRHGLEVFDVEQHDLNGGSFRTYIAHKGEKRITEEVDKMRRSETLLGLDTSQPYLEFADRVNANGHGIKEFIEEQVGNGKTVYVYGASTRGNTLLQHVGLDVRLITAAAERNPDKWGKHIVGSEIPIVSEAEARQANPDFFLVLPWFFEKSFVQREKEYLDNGGHFIIPLPRMKII